MKPDLYESDTGFEDTTLDEALTYKFFKKAARFTHALTNYYRDRQKKHQTRPHHLSQSEWGAEHTIEPTSQRRGWSRNK